MERKLVIFDVDGTLVETKSGETFRVSADDWQFLPNRVEKCKELREQGVKLAIASNQAGVAFPWSKFSQEQIQVELERTAEQIGADFVGVCYSSTNKKALPQYFNENDNRRKPGPGMLLEAMAHYGIAADETLMIGDRPEDQQAADAAGVSFMWAIEYFG